MHVARREASLYHLALRCFWWADEAASWIDESSWPNLGNIIVLKRSVLVALGRPPDELNHRAETLFCPMRTWTLLCHLHSKITAMS